jgi:serine/threonine protein phosphatase 1
MINQRSAPASLPPGERVYAIGDVHGCIDKLQDMHHRIASDLAKRPVAHATVVHLGDYIDRGPDSAAVIEELLSPWPGETPPQIVDLMGNHEDMMLSALAETDDPQFFEHWLRNGGGASLRSWGVAPHGRPGAWWDRLPARHLAFLQGLSLMHRAGGYVFVHAGVRPGVPLDEQTPADLLWIRDPFLQSTAPANFVVVHGHTPKEEPEVHPHRINADTGAVLGGPLTCVVLEADRVAFLQT